MEDQVISQPQVQEAPQAQPEQVPLTEADTGVEKLGGFVGMMVLSLVPVVNLVMFLAWGIGSPNVNRKNYGRAGLIVLAVLIVLSVVLGIVFTDWISSVMANFQKA